MRIVAVGAIARRSRMRHLRAFNLLGFFVVAGHAERLRVGLRKHHFAVLRGSVAGVARLVRERRMQELPHQLRCVGLVRVVAARAIRGRKGLVVMRLLQTGVLDVVAVHAERWSSLGQMEIELGFADLSGLVRRVAGVASHVERGVTAAFCGDVQSLRVTTKTEILPFVSGLGLQQLIFIVTGVRIVTLDAVAHCRRMHCPFQRGGIFLGVATQAHRLRSRCNQLDASDVFIDAHFVATQTSRGDRGVNRLAFRLILMALETLRRIDILVERHRMLFGPSGHRANHKEERQQLKETGKGVSDACCSF